jgi:hypothetical protein
MLAVAWIVFWFSLPCARCIKDCIPVLSSWFGKYKWGLLLAFSLFFLSACILLFKKMRERRINNILRLLNAFIIVTYILCTVRWVTYNISNAQDNNQPPIIAIKNNRLPNIYHVLLDEYTNENTLKKIGYNDSYFLQSLEQYGFLVFRNSRSNYFNTSNSVTSMLNMRYLMDNEEMNLNALDLLVKKNKVFATLLKLS